MRRADAALQSEMTAPALSVLDLVPVHTGQTSAEAVAASLRLVERADALGYRRYWFAEHHNMPSVASTTPPVLIAAAIGRSTTMRLGSGGVMLPNHSPLIVAEQFAMLEAMAPGRIDVGLGRAPGSDPVITQLLRRSGPTSDVEHFPDHVQDIAALASPEGWTVQFTSGGNYTVRATPAAGGTPEVWLLGSSDYAAQLAASLGLPYVFANHFSGTGLDRAMSLYRDGYRPSENYPEPKTFLTVNVVAAPTAEEAEARALPQLRRFASLRTNKPAIPQETVEQAAAAASAESDPAMTQLVQGVRAGWFVGTGETVAAQLREFAAKYDVDEIMLGVNAGHSEAEPNDSAFGRIQTLELISAAL